MMYNRDEEDTVGHEKWARLPLHEKQARVRRSIEKEKIWREEQKSKDSFSEHNRRWREAKAKFPTDVGRVVE